MAKLTADPGTAIRHLVSHHELKEHLVTRKQHMSSATFDDINWMAMFFASDSFPPLYHLWVSKHISGFCAFGSMMQGR